MGSKLKFLYVVMVAPFLLLSFIFVSCEPDPALPDYVGTWLIQDTILYNFDEYPVTMSAIVDHTLILNDDTTFTFAGTHKWEAEPIGTLEGNGTFAVDEGAGTFEFVYIEMMQNGTPMDMDIQNFQYEVQGDTLTLISPGVAIWVMYTPAEPLIYIRQ